jgi:preprotein translocase SecE subunit
MSGMNFKKTLLATLLILTLLFTMAIPAFAEETTGSSEEVTTEATGETTGGETAESVADGETTAGKTDGETTAGKTDGETTKASTTTSAVTTTATNDGWGVGDWVSLAIGVVIVGVIATLAVMFITVKDDGSAGKDGGKVPFRVRGKRFFKSTKSEAKKVVWTPVKTVRKNTIVVLIVMLVFAVVIGLLDWVLSQGIISLAGLF